MPSFICIQKTCPCQCADKLILETILQDKFFYFKAEEGGVAVATATDDNAEIRNLDARLFQKSTCWYTSFVTHFCIQKGHLPKSLPVSLLYFFKITHLYSIKGIGISSVQTAFPYIMMIWKQWQSDDMVKLSDFSPFWLCVPAFQQVCL